MTARSPLYIKTSIEIQVFSQAEIDAIVSQAVYVYSLNPSVSLEVLSSGGNLSGLPMADTRYQAGTSTTRVDRFATAAETPNINIVTVNYSRINETIASIAIPSYGPKSFPVYLETNQNIRAMTLQDFYDTFIYPAISALTSSSSGTNQAGTYFISSTTSVAGSTLVSNTPVFTDTRADVSQYTAGGIGETQDQPTTITNYYLHRINGVDQSSLPSTNYKKPLYIDINNNLREYSVTEFNNLLSNWTRYAAANEIGNKIRYNINGTGTTAGSAMINTRLSPTGTGYNTRFVNANDYRTQEFPNGTPVVANTYELKKTTV